jgi:hypothetical protein
MISFEFLTKEQLRKVKRSIWVNIYQDRRNGEYYTGNSFAFRTKQTAKQNIFPHSGFSKYTKTIHINF